MSFKIRAYTTDDVFFLVRILGALLGSAGEKLFDLFKEFNKGPVLSEQERASLSGEELRELEKKEEQQNEAFGKRLVMVVLKDCIQHAETPLKEWLASLISVSIEEFRKLPPMTVLLIVKELSRRPESRDFFSQAYQLYREMTITGTDSDEESEKS
jgi:hypothetical protein